MSYEYHKPISKMIEYSRVMKTHHENISDDYLNAQKELDHVYAQASKADEYEAKAKAFDRISEEVMLTKFDIFEKELIDEDTGYLALGKELARFVTKYERTECDD